MTEPKLVGDYEVIAQLASGGMAETHVARSLVDGSVVVIKRLLPRYLGNPEFIEMFEDEARVISGLHHPNVVELRKFGFHDGVPYIAMEYLHGVDLRTLTRTLVRLRKRPMPVDVALFIAGSMCAGLHHAHEARTLDGKPMDITHRDVSPQNVMLTFDGAVKLIDFGIATARGRTHETRSGALKGKIPYMAPEQVRAGVTDRRTDVYATGIVLYEMLTGRRPYVGARAKLGEFSLMMAIVNHDIVDPERLRGDLPPGLANTVMRAIALAPDHRYPSAAEMATALSEVAHQLGPRAAAPQLAALLLDTIGPRKRRVETRSSSEMLELISEVEAAKTSVDERHDPRTVEASERGPLATGPRGPEPPRGVRPPAAEDRPALSREVAPERDRAPAAPPIDKVVHGDRTVLRVQRALPPAFRWSRLFDGIEGVIEIDFGDVELGERALQAAADALAGLGREVLAVRLVAAPIALVGRVDARCTVVSVACRGRCPRCAVDPVTAVLGYDELIQRLAVGREVECPRCGGALVDLALGALPLPAPVPPIRTASEAAPGAAVSPPSAASIGGARSRGVGSPTALPAGRGAAPPVGSIGVPRAPVARPVIVVLALALGVLAIVVAGWYAVRVPRRPPELPSAAVDRGSPRVWRDDRQWIAEVEADGIDDADAAARCHARALGAAIAEIEAALPPRIRGLCTERAGIASDPGPIALARRQFAVSHRGAAVHAVASYTVPSEALARAIRFHAAVAATWGLELVNAPPSCGPGVLVLTAPGGSPIAAGDRIRSAGARPLASLDAITAELGERTDLELVVDHHERRTLSVRPRAE